MMRLLVAYVLMLMVLVAIIARASDEATKEAEQKIKTIYGIDGRPYSQSEYAKGLHQVWGTAKMINGVDTIEINTSTQDGTQDVSFGDATAYFGTARAFVDNGHSYKIVPISGNKFVIISSDTTGSDTSSVRFKLEGH